MILSTLGRKVLNQTNIPQNDLGWYWWIEQMLQMYRINCLVKMINGSKKMDQTYIMGYAPMYRWGERTPIEVVDISKHHWIFALLQMLESDFPWGIWDRLVMIPELMATTFAESIYKTQNAGKSSVNYALVIYDDEVRKMKQADQEFEKADKKVIQFPKEKLSKSKVQEWDDIKDKL